jgi:peptidyl-Lys metalloendopeptidase
MRKHIPWSIVLVCLALAATPALAGSLGSAALGTYLSLEKAELTTADSVNVHFSLTNQGADDLLVLKWKTPLAGFENDLFVVERDGERVPYTGRLVKRAAPQAGDYVRIPGGESVSVVFDLASVYDLRQPGNYTVRYEAAGIDVVREDFQRGQTILSMTDALESNTESLTLTGADLRGPEVIAAPMQSIGDKALPPTYLNCSSSNISAIGNALTNAQNYATESYNFLVGLPAASRATDARYTTWFGAYTSSRYSTVQSHYNSLKNAFAGQTFQLDCDCASDNSLYAFVYANQPYHVHLCGAFFAAPATGTDSKAGTLVHETSHFTVVAGTNDYAYGQTACKKLANKTPNKAINNADSHEYFAENTPFQSIQSVKGLGPVASVANCAQYVGEDPPLDGATWPKNTTLNKRWRIKNCGTAQWTTSWGVHKVSQPFGSPTCADFNLTGTVNAGSTVTITATCPIGAAGKYEVHFKMKTPAGVTFGDEFWFIVNAQ